MDKKKAVVKIIHEFAYEIDNLNENELELRYESMAEEIVKLFAIPDIIARLFNETKIEKEDFDNVELAIMKDDETGEIMLHKIGYVNFEGISKIPLNAL